MERTSNYTTFQNFRPMHNPRKALKARSLRGQKMARARRAADRARRDAEEPVRVAEMAAAVARGEGPWDSRGG
jgi:hypothetical protein